MTYQRVGALLQRVAAAIEQEAKAPEPDWSRTLDLCYCAMQLEHLVEANYEAHEALVRHVEALMKEKA